MQWIEDGRANREMSGVFKTAHSSALVFPFASAVVGAKGPSELFIMLNQAVYHFVNLYLLFLFIRYGSAALVHPFPIHNRVDIANRTGSSITQLPLQSCTPTSTACSTQA